MAEVQIDDERIVINRRMLAAMRMGAKRDIPFAALSGIVVKPPTRVKKGHVQLLGEGWRRESPNASDPNTLIFTFQQREAMGEFVDLVHAHIPGPENSHGGQTLQVSDVEGFPLEVRGESFYQDAIRRLVDISGAEMLDDDRMQCELRVLIQRDPQNKFSKTAVRVSSLAGETLGHVPEELSAGYFQFLEKIGEGCRIACDACAFGRLAGSDWNIGIWLALPPVAEMAEALDHDQPPRGGTVTPAGVRLVIEADC